jgi:hypothetical protein
MTLEHLPELDDDIFLLRKARPLLLRVSSTFLSPFLHGLPPQPRRYIPT